LIAPLVAELAETRIQLFAHADRIVELARENGRLTERLEHVELERARAALDDLQAGQLVSQAEEVGRLKAELGSRA
jgi:hypothetical protein